MNPVALQAWRTRACHLPIDPPFRHDGGGLDDQQTGPAHRPAGVMDKMPVPGHAVGGGVLAHGGNADAVVEGQTTQGKRGEQVGHGISFKKPKALFEPPRPADASRENPTPAIAPKIPAQKKRGGYPPRKPHTQRET